MVLLRWIYLRKLVPIEDVIAGAESGPGIQSRAGTGSAPGLAPGASAESSGTGRPMPAGAAGPASAPSLASDNSGGSPGSINSAVKDALLAEIRKAKVVFYQTVVAQAQKIEVSDNSLSFSFSPAQRALRDQFEQNRAWLESIAQKVSGRKIVVTSAQAESAASNEASSGEASSPGASSAAEADPAAVKKSALREKALADSGVKALLEVFPAEIRDVEEM
jgi:hypothetical protein